MRLYHAHALKRLGGTVRTAALILAVLLLGAGYAAGALAVGFAAAGALAGALVAPVGGEVIRFTNNPWIIRPALIPEKLGASRYTVVNDFGAVGHAVACADPDHFLHLAGPDEPLPAKGTISIVGPGTGLGVSGLVPDANGLRMVLRSWSLFHLPLPLACLVH